MQCLIRYCVRILCTLLVSNLNIVYLHSWLFYSFRFHAEIKSKQKFITDRFSLLNNKIFIINWIFTRESRKTSVMNKKKTIYLLVISLGCRCSFTVIIATCMIQFCSLQINIILHTHNELSTFLSSVIFRGKTVCKITIYIKVNCT